MNASIQSNCSAGWSAHAAGADWYKVPFYPYGNATYWYYVFARTPGDTTGLRFTTDFGHARYQSLTVYDDTGNPVANLRDDDTAPDTGSHNPFILAVDRDSEKRRYTVDVVPGQTNGADGNTITFADQLEPKTASSTSSLARRGRRSSGGQGGSTSCPGGSTTVPS